jgi:hypothetical protein
MACYFHRLGFARRVLYSLGACPLLICTLSKPSLAAYLYSVRNSDEDSTSGLQQLMCSWDHDCRASCYVVDVLGAGINKTE